MHMVLGKKYSYSYFQLHILKGHIGINWDKLNKRVLKILSGNQIITDDRTNQRTEGPTEWHTTQSYIQSGIIKT